MKQTILILLPFVMHFVSWTQATASSLGPIWGAKTRAVKHCTRQLSLRIRIGVGHRKAKATLHSFTRCDNALSNRRRLACFLSFNLNCHQYYPMLVGTKCVFLPIQKQLENPSCSNLLMSSSGSTSRGQRRERRVATATPKRKNVISKRSDGNDRSKGRRMKKSEMNDLVRGVGLEPVVVQSAPPSMKETKATSTGMPNRQPNIDKSSRRSIESVAILDQQSPPAISLQAQLDHSRHGHTVLRSFLPQPLIQQLRSELVPFATSHSLYAWSQKVEVQLSDSPDEYFRENARSIAEDLKTVEECQALLESLGIDVLSGDLPFLQHFNTWRAHAVDKTHYQAPTVRELCLSPYLAQAASILLNASTIRLYQDSLFHKRVGDGWTPWHSDARMAPFDTSKIITFWIPLQRVPTPEDGGTGLLFVDGSHSDFALPYWNGAEGGEYERLEQRYVHNNDSGGVSHHMPLGVGDVTVHNGWTLHCAQGANYREEGENRYAFAITYVDGCAELREDVLSSGAKHHVREGSNDATNGGSTPTGDEEDIWSFRSWVEEVKPRTEFRHAHVPIVWPLESRDI